MQGNRDVNNRIISTTSNSDNYIPNVSEDTDDSIYKNLGNLNLHSAMSSTPQKAMRYNNNDNNSDFSPDDISNYQRGSSSVKKIDDEKFEVSMSPDRNSTLRGESMFNQNTPREDVTKGDISNLDSDFPNELSSKDVPHVTNTMTPWKQKRPDSIGGYGISSPFKTTSSTSSVHRLNRTPFDIKEDDSSSISQKNEIDKLKRVITSLKLRNSSYEEIIKHENLQGIPNGMTNDKRNSIYKRLLEQLSTVDDTTKLREENEELKNKLKVKEQELDQVQQDQQQTEKEYTTTLNEVEEYIKKSEEMSGRIDEMLDFIRTVSFKTSQIEDDENEILQKAINFGPNYTVVKLVALESSMKNLLKRLQDNETKLLAKESEVQFNKRGSIMANSTQINEHDINGKIAPTEPQPDLIIQQLHKDYEQFMKTIREKLTHSSQLEESLLGKLSKQNNILRTLNLEYKRQIDESSFEDHNESTSNTVEQTIPEKTGEQSIPLSYMKHITSLEELKEKLEMDLSRSNEEIHALKESVQDNANLKKNNDLLLRKIENLEVLANHKDKNWTDLVNELETQSKELTDNNHNLEELLENVQLQNSELKVVNADLDSKLHELNDTLDDDEDKIRKLTESNHAIRELAIKEKADHSQKIDVYEEEFQEFSNTLFLHIVHIFETLKTIIEQRSIEQSFRKIDRISMVSTLGNINTTNSKMKAIYSFVEMALSSIIQSYTDILIESSENDTSNHDTNSGNLARGEEEARNLQLRLNEVQSRWVSERERRKLESNTAEARITKLQLENDLLKEQIFNTSLKKT